MSAYYCRNIELTQFLLINSLHTEKQSDLLLIKRYLENRDASAFNLLYLRYSAKVYAKCISMLKDETRAADATQEIFTKVFLKLGSFGEKAKFSTWLYSVTYNYCIDYIRKQKRDQLLFTDSTEDLPEYPEDDDDQELLAMEVGRLRKVLEVIPPGDKVILLMKYQDDLSIKEIAEALNKNESAVKMQLKRAKTKAKMAYKKLYKPD